VPSSSVSSALVGELFSIPIRAAMNQPSPLAAWLEEQEYKPGWSSAVAWLESREQQRNDAAEADREWPWPKRPLDFDTIEQRLLDHYMDKPRASEFINYGSITGRIGWPGAYS
jgi:hypothetical protein